MENTNKISLPQELKTENQEMVLFRTDDEQVAVDVIFAEETVWLTIDQMARLYEKSRSTINEHILNIYNEGELSKEQSLRKIGISDFSTKPTNLTMSGEQLLEGSGSISHAQAEEKARTEYRKYQQRTLSEVEHAFLDSVIYLGQSTKK